MAKFVIACMPGSSGCIRDNGVEWLVGGGSSHALYKHRACSRPSDDQDNI